MLNITPPKISANDRDCGDILTKRNESESLDSLTECILFIAKHHGHTLSSTSLLSGLPLDDNGRLTPNMAEAAAHNAGLSAKIIKSPLRKIVGFALPAVLFLKDETACVDGHPNGATDGHLNDAIKSERFSLGRPRLVMCL